mgnify:CR=1 FL=1
MAIVFFDELSGERISAKFLAHVVSCSFPKANQYIWLKCSDPQ